MYEAKIFELQKKQLLPSPPVHCFDHLHSVNSVLTIYENKEQLTLESAQRVKAAELS